VSFTPAYPSAYQYDAATSPLFIYSRLWDSPGSSASALGLFEFAILWLPVHRSLAIGCSKPPSFALVFVGFVCLWTLMRYSCFLHVRTKWSPAFFLFQPRLVSKAKFLVISRLRKPVVGHLISRQSALSNLLFDLASRGFYFHNWHLHSVFARQHPRDSKH